MGFPSLGLIFPNSAIVFSIIYLKIFIIKKYTIWCRRIIIHKKAAFYRALKPQYSSKINVIKFIERHTFYLPFHQCPLLHQAEKNRFIWIPSIFRISAKQLGVPSRRKK
jgi:hypothetical protein